MDSSMVQRCIWSSLQRFTKRLFEYSFSNDFYVEALNTVWKKQTRHFYYSDRHWYLLCSLLSLFLCICFSNCFVFSIDRRAQRNPIENFLQTIRSAFFSLFRYLFCCGVFASLTCAPSLFAHFIMRVKTTFSHHETKLLFFDFSLHIAQLIDNRKKNTRSLIHRWNANFRGAIRNINAGIFMCSGFVCIVYVNEKNMFSLWHIVTEPVYFFVFILSFITTKERKKGTWTEHTNNVYILNGTRKRWSNHTKSFCVKRNRWFWTKACCYIFEERYNVIFHKLNKHLLVFLRCSTSTRHFFSSFPSE